MTTTPADGADDDPDRLEPPLEPWHASQHIPLAGARSDSRSDAELYETLGRVAACLRWCADLTGHARYLDWWRTADGGLAFDWLDGPYAHEVTDALIAIANDPITSTTLLPGSVYYDPDPRWDPSNRATWSVVRVNGFVVQFRATSPLGQEEAHRRFRAAMRRDREATTDS